MPRKIRELIRDLKKAGFEFEPGKGSHRKFYKGNVVAVLSGQEGADAHHYQERHVREKIREAGNEKDNC
jgi:predicted RNA binding protein YcfA (HicA-like mRNA interferase family)